MKSFLVRHGPALTLAFLSPLIAEFLLGNMSIDLLWALVVLAPFYGGGALLVREASLRWHVGWPGRFALGLAYGVIEEGLVTQSLFNPNYLGLRLLDYGHVAVLGMGAWWTVFVLALHSVWSVAASIGLAESLWPERRDERWVQGPGLSVVAVLFLAGCTLNSRLGGNLPPKASLDQLAGSLLAAVLLVAAVWLLGRRPPRARRTLGSAPTPVFAAAAAFVLLSLFMISTRATGRMPPAWNLAWMLGTLLVLAACVWRWSSAAAWNVRHELALVTGALATYGWWSLTLTAPVSLVGPALDTAGNVVVIAATAGLVILAFRRVEADTARRAGAP